MKHPLPHHLYELSLGLKQQSLSVGVIFLAPFYDHSEPRQASFASR
jgi:hypothetical protein